MAQKITIRELVTKFSFQTDRAGLAQYAGIVSGIKNSLDLLRGIASAVGGALRTVTTEVIDLGDQTDETAESLGLTSEALQELQGVAKFSGVENEKLTVGLKTLSKTTEAFIAGGGAAKDVLLRMGIEAKQLAGVPLDERLTVIAEGFAQIPPGAEQAAAAQRLFGGSGLDMVRVLRQGSAGIRAIRGDMRAFGIISNETAALAGEVNDNLDRLRLVARGAQIEIGSQLLPVINDVAMAMVSFYRSNRDVIGQGIAGAVKLITVSIAGLKMVLGPVVELFMALTNPTKEANKNLSALDRTLVTLKFTLAGFGLVLGAVKLQGIITGGKTLLALIPAIVAGVRQFGVIATITKLFATLRTGALAAWAAVYAGPLAIAALVGGLALLYQDISAFIDGEDSLIGRFIARFKGAEGYVGSLAATLQYLFAGSGLRDFVAFFDESIDSIIENIDALITKIRAIPIIGGVLGTGTPATPAPATTPPAAVPSAPRIVSRTSNVTVGAISVTANNAGTPEEVGLAVRQAIQDELGFTGRALTAADDDGEGRRG